MVNRYSLQAFPGALIGVGLVACIGVAAAAPSAPIRVDVEELQRCRSLTEAAQRLACYDRALLPLVAPTRTSVLDPAAVPATIPAVVRSSAAVAEATTRSPADLGSRSEATPGQATPQFGLPRSADEELMRVSSVLLGSFTGWLRGYRFELANGQVWEVIDNSVGVYRLQSPKATVQRGFLGSYFIEIEGVQQTPKVRRLR